MLKPFYEALVDGFAHMTDISDRDFREYLRTENVAVDDEGIWIFSFGEHKEFDLIIEPTQEPDEYFVALYKHHILLIPKLYVKAADNQH